MSEPIHLELLTSKSPESYFGQIARIHQDEIKSGFLSTLGTKFLVRLYKHLSVSPYSFIFAAISGSQVLGFICGSTDTTRVYKSFMLHSGLSSLAILFPRLLSFERIKQVLETLLYPGKKENLGLPNSEIFNFCVSQPAQQRGIGKMLFAALVKEFQRLNIEQIKIVTGAEQKKAQNFYNSMQAQRVREIEIHKGTKSFIFVYNIQKESNKKAC